MLIQLSIYRGIGVLKLIVSGACLCSAATMAWAQSPGLSGQQISELVAGATVEIDTPAGTKLPVRYTQEGRLSGEARDLAWYLGSATDAGRWWVAGDQLCHKWIRWFNAEPQCMRLSQEGRLIRWRSQDGNSGTAAITVPRPRRSRLRPCWRCRACFPSASRSPRPPRRRPRSQVHRLGSRTPPKPSLPRRRHRRPQPAR